jgi:ankyrin repeat protein
MAIQLDTIKLKFEHVKDNDVQSLKCLIQKTKSPTVALYGNYLIHAAAKFNRAEVIGFLVKNGSPVDILNDDGSTALHMAARNKQKLAVEALIDLGADLTILNEVKNTPLLESLMNERSSTKLKTYNNLISLGTVVLKNFLENSAVAQIIIRHMDNVDYEIAELIKNNAPATAEWVESTFIKSKCYDINHSTHIKSRIY